MLPFQGLPAAMNWGTPSKFHYLHTVSPWVIKPLIASGVFGDTYSYHSIKKNYHICLMSVHACMRVWTHPMQRPEDNLAEVGSLLLPCGSQGLNSGHQTGHVPLSTDPSDHHHPPNLFLLNYFEEKNKVFKSSFCQVRSWTAPHSAKDRLAILTQPRTAQEPRCEGALWTVAPPAWCKKNREPGQFSFLSRLLLAICSQRSTAQNILQPAH